MRLFLRICLLTIPLILMGYGVTTAQNQNREIVLELENENLPEAFKKLEKASGYKISFIYDDVDNYRVTSKIKTTDINNALKQIIGTKPFDYTIDRQFVTVVKKEGEQSAETSRANPKRTITGHVYDIQGRPLVGAGVNIKGTNVGSLTDIEGAYTLQAATGSVLRFSYLGFDTKEITVGQQNVLNITLEEDSKDLDEVIVIGYGAMRRKDITTAVSTVSTEDINQRPLMSAAQAIQGRAAGVQVVQPSGEPGSGVAIRVRGATSVQASNEPLYIIDGMPTNTISDISPNDIESMQILKDASSAAIYGARAANGVVLITTKRGQVGKTKLSLSAYAGISKLGNKIKALDTEEYKELMGDLKAQGTTAAPNIPEDEHRYVDWTDKLFKTGVNQNYQLSLTSGTDKIQYAVSGGYTDEKGIVNKAHFNRYNFRANVDSQHFSWVDMSLNFSYSRTKGQWIRSNSSSLRSGSILSSINTPPFMQEWDPNNPDQYDESAYGSRIMNPLAANAADNITSTTYLRGLMALTFKIYEGLNLRTSFGIDTYDERWSYYLDPLRTADGRATKGKAEESWSDNREWLLENILTYDRSFGKHSISLMAGATQQHAQGNNMYLAGWDMALGFPNLHMLNAANQINKDTAGSSGSAWSIASFLGRINYNYDDRYLFTANFRSDGSSRFAPGHRWGYFPSISVGWRISSEKFMESTKNVIDDMKIRVGWGVNGNQGGIGNYSYLAHFGTSRVEPTTDNLFPGLAIWKSSAANKELTWEKTYQWNAGLDVSLFNSRLNLTIDAYYKKTKDLLLDVTLPANISNISGGFTRNDGEMLNKGMEFLVSSRNIRGVFNWDTDFNISFNRNKVTKLGLAKVYYYAETYGTEEKAIILKEGLELGSFFGYVSDGVDPETGDIIYSDLSGNGEIGPEDRTVIGSAQPDFIYGMTNTFSYKGLSLSIFLQGSQGNDIFNASRIDTEGMMDFRNQSRTVLDRWKRPGMQTNVPRPGNPENIHNSTRFIEDGSYLRIKNITLAYDFAPSFLKKMHLSRLQVYVTGQNLFTFTKYSGYDPEVNAHGRHAVAMGVDYGTYPQSKAIVFGLNIEF